MTIDLRTLTDDPGEHEAWWAVIRAAFGTTFDPESHALWAARMEPGRSIVAYDGDEVCGTTGSFSFRMTVPGGAVVPTAGVTMVTVKPTHRRRGVLTSMMRRQLEEVRERREPLAVLRASEPLIYGRFGYGAASDELGARVDTARTRLALPAGADALRLRLVDPCDPEVLAACEELYARRVPLRPGMLERRPGWERAVVHDPEDKRDGATPMQCVLAERDGELRGYARYAVRPHYDAADNPDGEVLLRDMEALDPAAHGALVRYLFDLDLTSTLCVEGRPVDDPWLHLVTDPRRCGISRRDALYLRVIDVAAALEARTYAAGVDVVLELEDAFCPWNAGRWRLSGGPKGATCTRTGDPADLALSVPELGAAYLGGVPLAALADAGRVRELREGALAEAATAFHSAVAPWNPHGF
ncbi:GNAT family N-acetyltransferase [Streptomyces sp. RKND-216]|uniref:GNAT family N-acetyltransferase n=1 Tax=Streptomyces sp. RKND-216 TaxID=2562581 RepID=UPI001FF7DC0A|nr:GNAT family N-acetyltransferase [Streptomyces sp. RKND-216]